MIVFYISSHGLGHASRAIEVIHAIAALRPRSRFLVRSAVPSWFLETSLRVGAALECLDTDTGVTQIDSLRLDETDTARRAARFYAEFTARVDEEASRLRRVEAQVVVADIPPLAFAAADRAGVPSVAIGNFTWDWIYEGYAGFEQAAPGVVATIRSAYARATCSLRLPFHGGFDAAPDTVTDIPLIARRSERGRDGTRHSLELGPTELVVLASFGGYGLGLSYDRVAASCPFTMLTTGDDAPDSRGADARRGVRRLTRPQMAGLGLRYPDLVAASDVVVSKPGYGIVSECIANGAALLYTSRGRFREHEVFVSEMPRVLRCRYIPQDDLLAGRWTEPIDALLRSAPPPERLGIDGARAAAEAVIALGRLA
jgi:L-arabinokinase